MQGLFGAAAASGAAVALQLYAQLLYDARAAGARAALPFFVSLGAECAGATLFVSAMWPELPQPATIPSLAPVAQGIEHWFPEPGVGRSNRSGGAEGIGR